MMNVKGYKALQDSCEEAGADSLSISTNIMIMELAELGGLSPEANVKVMVFDEYHDELPKTGAYVLVADESYHVVNNGVQLASCWFSYADRNFTGKGYCHTLKMEYTCDSKKLHWRSDMYISKEVPFYAKLPTRPVLPVTEKSV